MFSTILLSAFIALFSLTEHVIGQTCSGQVPYGSCSSNNACACLPLSFSSDIGICALLGTDCSRLNPCQSPYNTCDDANHICVQHPQCGSRPVCYPLVMTDQRLCPPSYSTTYIPTTSTMATWTSTYSTWTSTMVPWTSTVATWTSTMATWTSTVSTWTSTMVPWTSTEATWTSTMAAWTSTEATWTSTMGPWTSTYSTWTTTGYPSTTSMPMFVYSNFFGELTNTSDTYSRSNVSNTNGTNGTSTYFYQAVQLIVTQTGVYNISSSSTMDTYGSLYLYEFSPFNPTNNLLMADDDSAGDRQFQLQYYLYANHSYILVVTTYAEETTGYYALSAQGPATIGFISMNTTTISNSTWFPGTESFNNTVYYSSMLKIGGPTFARENNSQGVYYYEAIPIYTDVTGDYTLSTEGSLDTYGYLYQHSFYPTFPSMNLLQSNDDSAGNGQFALQSYLQAYTTYILVVTSFNAHATGAFTAVASGPGTVRFY